MHKLPPHPLTRLGISLMLALCAATPCISHAQTKAQKDQVARGEPITLNFSNADIEAVARTMAVITGRNVVVDPRVKGTLNLTTEKPVSPLIAFNQFQAALRLQGYTVVETSGLYKVVPEAEGKLQSSSVSAGPVVAGGNQIVTQIFRLNFETAANLLPILRPLISANNIINVNPGNNSLIITDYAENLRRISSIIAAMDVSTATDIEVIPLQNAIASDLAPLVSRLSESSGGSGATPGQTDTGFRTTIVAESRSNTLIVRAANPARLALIRSLVNRLDQPGVQNSNGAAGNIYVVHLKNADATKLAVTLRAAMSGDATAIVNVPRPVNNIGAGASLGSSQASSQPSTGGQIQADPATNSLIITAPEPQFRQIKEVIERLDARRAQVFVESLIAEVNADKAAEFGIQWQGALGRAGDTNVGLLGTNFGTDGSNIIALSKGAAAGTVVPKSGLNVGVAHRTNGIYVLGFLARFLEQNGDGNVLSTPNLLTLDNEEAKIVIGQNVPFVTGQFTNTNSGGNGAVNPFQTIERKDVGLTLRVKPQISENGTVKLTIFQEVSSVQASSINSATGLITNKRTIESNVLVEDGAIVVLGGLLQDEYSGTQDKVPVLGDVPLFGNLFKSESRSRKKTNLMVFLRPVVMRDAAASESLTADRYDLMRTNQREAQPTPSAVLPINTAPILPSLRMSQELPLGISAQPKPASAPPASQ
ncbi:MAG: type II secretion system secretin GspD [Pseudomonadota bacterium]